MAQSDMAIGEFARRTGGNIETIRYYERIGLLPLPDRRGKYRRYGLADLGRLKFIRRGRELGFTIDEVRALLGLSETGIENPCAEIRDLAARHLHAVQAKIVDLRAIETTLAEAVRSCDAGVMTGCPMIDALSGQGNYTHPA